jgi:hypothetical protein
MSEPTTMPLLELEERDAKGLVGREEDGFAWN